MENNFEFVITEFVITGKCFGQTGIAVHLKSNGLTWMELAEKFSCKDLLCNCPIH